MPELPDIILRTVAVMSAVLLALIMLATGRQRPAAVPGALFCLAVAAFFLTSGAGAASALGVSRYPLTALCITKAVWFWLFARALFIDRARLEPRHFVIASAVAVVGTWQQTAFLPSYRAGATTASETVVGLGFEGALLLFVVLGLYATWRDLAVDLEERRRRLRLAFIALTGIYLAVALAVQSYNLFEGAPTPSLVARANMLVVAASFFTAAWFLLMPRSGSWLDTARPAAAAALNSAESTVLARLERALETDRVHLHEGLSIGALAMRLRTGEHVLRRVINQGMGYRNFNDFLHAWRIREACEELARPEQARIPVLSIAMKVGYGSIGAFNRAFKARIGMTPTDYRRSRMNEASHAG